MCEAAGYPISARTLEDWTRSGKLVPEATVRGTHVWRRSTVQAWLDACGPECGIEAVCEPLDVIGFEWIAEHRGVTLRTAQQAAWRKSAGVPEPDATVPGGVMWARSSLEDWLEGVGE